MKSLTKICAPVMADTVEEMVNLMRKAKEYGADLVEIRLDHLKIFDPTHHVSFIIKNSPMPTLFTYRPKWEGGQYEGDEGKRLDVLRLAMEQGADYIDVELQVAEEFNNSITGKKPENCKVIVSSHNYQCTPEVEALGNLAVKIQSTGADIVKIATTAVDITDVARMFQITANSQVPVIGLVMGERGLISRILGPKFGGYLTFGTIERGKVSAPGQPTIDDLVELYNFRHIRPDTEVFGILGKPVGHSKSPVLYNRSFKSVGFNGVYVPFLVDNVQNFFETYSSPDFAGFRNLLLELLKFSGDLVGRDIRADLPYMSYSCTIPHKEAALRCCDEVDPVAKSIGAVNCIIKRPNDGKLLGYNTDYTGAITAIEDGLSGTNSTDVRSGSPLAGKLFVIIGAGGAGKALAYGAKEKGARVVIANRTYDRARDLANIVGGDAISLGDLENFHPQDNMILANTTSIGMHPKVDETPVPKHVLKHYSLVFDAVYTPKMTRLLRESAQAGAIIVNGLEMFIGQAFEQYERFTGLPAPKELFRKILEQ